MSSLSATYGTIATATVASRDGHRYRCEIGLHGYDGPADAMPLVGLAIAWGADGGAVTGGAPLAPVAASRAILTVANDRPGRLSFVGSLADLAVRLRLVRETGDEELTVADGGPGVCWVGYALPESVEDAPYDAQTATQITFIDGLGFLESRPYAGDGASVSGRDVYSDGVDGWQARSPLAGLLHNLSSLGGDPSQADPAWAGLTTAVDWRPWMPTEDGSIAADEDPLARLLIRESVWLDADGASVSVLAALRAIAERFNARLFQSGGRWHLVQRGLLARTAGLDVPRFTYDAGEATVSTAGTPETADVVRETRTLMQGGGVSGPRRSFALPVRMVESATAMDEEFSNVVVNGGFEQEGATSADALGWTGVQATRVVGTDWYETATAGDRHVMELSSEWEGGTRGEITQQGMVVPASPDWAFHVRWQHFMKDYADYNTSDDPAPYGGLTLEVGDFWAVASAINSVGDIYPGENAQIRIEKLAGDIGSAVEGTLAIPEGTTLRFTDDPTTIPLYGERFAITLSKPARVGDLYLVGEVRIKEGLTVPVTASHRSVYHRWATGGVPYPVSGALDTDTVVPAPEYTLTARRLTLPGTTLAGEAVSGYLQTTFVGAATALDATGPGGSALMAVDDVEVALESRGSNPSAYGVRARLPGGVPGLDVALPEHVAGDGPTAQATGVLDVRLPSGLHERTNQGADTGWTWGAFDPEDESTGITLDELAATDGLAQLAHAERVQTDYLLRGGPAAGTAAALAPEHVTRHWPLVALAFQATAGAETIHTYVPPPVGAEIVVGAQTAAGLPRAAAETHTVVSVTPGAGLYLVEIAAPLAATHPEGSRCAYGRLYWWDAFRWDVPAGTVATDATALDLDPRTPSTELVLST